MPVPVRTCVSCRGEGGRHDLVRIVAGPDGSAVVDYRSRLPGRGAWLHVERPCVDRVIARPGVLSKALRGQIDSSDLRGQLVGHVQRALAGGFDVLSKALAARQTDLVLVAEDAAERTIAGLERVAADEVVFVKAPVGRDELGTRIGRGPRAALGVLRSSATTHLRRQLHRWEAVG